MQRAAMALWCLLPMTALQAEVREFKSAQGTAMRGELKKARGQTILFRTEDGRDLQIDLKSFSADDQLFILKWMAESPEAVDHTFAVKAVEKEIPMTKDEKEMAIKQVIASKIGRYAPDVSTERKAYEISLSSTTRAALYDVSVDWCVFMLNKVRTREKLVPGKKPGKPAPDASKSEVVESDSSDTTKGVLRVKRGHLFIPQMDYAETETIKTGSFTLNSVATSPRTSDKLVGVWLRFYRGETLVFEFKSPQCPNTEWPGGARQATAKPEIASTADEPTPARPGKPPAGPKPAPATKPAMTEEEESIVSIFELDEKKK